MEKLVKFIEDDLERFSNMEEDEVIELDAHYMDDDIVNYLKDLGRPFQHKGICMYYLKGEDEVWIENMNAE